MNSLVIFLMVRCMAIVHSQLFDTLKPLQGYSLEGSPLSSFKTDSVIHCSITCSRYNNCYGFTLVNHQCNIYSVLDVNYALGSQNPTNFLNLDRLAVHRPAPIIAPTSPWGNFGPVYNCAKNKGVGAINVWYAYFADSDMGVDDVGVAEVEIVCSGTDGIVDSAEKDGLYNLAATKRSLWCPTGSFVYAIKFMHMPGQGSLIDDAAMVGLAATCNDPANTTKYLASGEGTALYPWTLWQACDAGFVICGFSIQTEPVNADNTSVNGMHTTCCLIT